MIAPILRTKLFVPQVQPNQVRRQRLYERLRTGMGPGRRLTLVSAPPGSGKTTLLSGWAAQSRELVAWLALDSEDNDLARFRATLLAALQRVVPGLEGDSARVASPATILNGLASLSRIVVLILDDYQVISNPAIHEDVTVLLEGMPPSFHLILSTRVDPPLPIPRLRVRGQLNELRADDLRFTAQEAAQFLNEKMGLRLSAGDVETLEARTEGWIAGLQLAALSMQGRADLQEFIAAFSGGHRYLQEYLAGEVIDRLPASTREFLIQTSILDLLNGPLCSAVSGHPNSASLLSELEHSNLFTMALDDEYGWYRYHALFADALRQRLAQTCPADRINELHLRASAWLETHGALSAAVEHALAAQDFERVARLAEQAVQASLLDSRMTILLKWVAMMPEAVVCAHPRLRAFQAWAMFVGGRFGPAQRILLEVRQSLESLPPSPENDRLRDDLVIWLGVMETLLTGFMQGLGGSLDQACAAYRAAREQALAIGILSLAALATEGLALARYHQGHLRQSAQLCREVIDLGRKGTGVSLPLAAAGHIELAGICYEWNELREVERHLKLGMTLCQQSGDALNLAEAYLVQSRLYKSQGDMESAFEALRQAGQALAAIPYSVTHFKLDLQWVYLYLAAARPEDAAQRLREMEERASYAEFRPISLYEIRQMGRARAYLEQGQPQQALTLLDGLLGQAEADGRLRYVMEMLLLKALALQALGRMDTALAALSRSLALAEAGGVLRIYLDEGAPAQALLQEAARRGIATVYANRLLALWPPQAGSSADNKKLIAPLTPTELKILRLIAEGYSNREITEQMVIALNTVKRHSSHIYAKLNVKSRTQAIVRARQLGLLPAQTKS